MHIKGFLKLIKKYREETLPPEKKEVMDRWYDVMGQVPEEVADKDQLKEKVWEGILSKVDEGVLHDDYPEGKRWWMAGYWRVAAACVFLVAGGVYFFEGKISQGSATVAYPEKEGWVRVSNSTQATREVLLTDGSRIVLEPGSSLYHPAAFLPDSRTVYMEGNVFFDVAKDAKRPFFVRSGDVTVSVLGTSFTIREIGEASATEVAVLSGKVVVEKSLSRQGKKNSHSKDNKIILTPNKKVTFFRDSDHYVTGLVDKPVMVEKSEEYVKPKAFDFDDVPLGKILEKLEKAYGVSIAVTDQSILECRLTADLSSDNLYGKIEVISAILNARYEIAGSSILLSDCVCNVLDN